MLDLQNIIKTFSRGKQTTRAVDDVSLTIADGEILGLVGESGCGKSTLSRIIMQLLHPDSGKILMDGVDLTTLKAREVRTRRLDFQMVFQDPHASLNPRMTVFSTLSEALQQRHKGITKSAITDRVAEIMGRVGLNAAQMQKYPHEFSGGQRQRIAIARALSTDPKLIIADEPVSALDVSIQSQILNLLKSLQKDLGLAMLFISHDLSVVHYLSDRIAVMHKGKIVESGTADQVFLDPSHDYTRTLLRSIPRIAK